MTPSRRIEIERAREIDREERERESARELEGEEDVPGWLDAR